MTSAVEVFVIELARNSKRAERFIRHLPKADREDILQSALAWCWENRESYSLTTSLETWFVNAVRDAHKAWNRGESQGAPIVGELMSTSEPSAEAEILQIKQQLITRIAEMPLKERQIAALLMRQWTYQEITAKLQVADKTISEVRRKLAPFKRHLPKGERVGHLFRRMLIPTVTPKAPTSDEPPDDASAIDAELQSLDFPPEHGAECPPCWRCMWFEGWLPGDNKSVRMPIVEEDVRKAVEATERRKIEIATEVQNGDL
jgi:DNA-directed RNA polymerase specialized sigma24 family protein